MQTIIDSHVHCGIQDNSFPQSFQDYLHHIQSSDISGAAVFSPVEEIYDRSDPFFQDNENWKKKRQQSNQYVLSLKDMEFQVFPYFFIWNDFAVDQISSDFLGIKWHRHADEPEYNYDSTECAQAIEFIRNRNMPVVLEEELSNTIRFIRELAEGVRVIIPHLGALNGGYRAVQDSGLWELKNVYTDTSLASRGTIEDYIYNYGCGRLMFGSDFPFGHPKRELEKLRAMDLSEEDFQTIAGRNIQDLLQEVRAK
mgnify:CR=1 FL=1